METKRSLAQRLHRLILICTPLLLMGLFISTRTGADGTDEYKLPWTADAVWYYTGGPHPGNIPASDTAWSAIDFGTPTREVRAVEGGVVIFSDWFDGALGNVIGIQHEFGYASWYAHLETRGVLEGVRVERGSVIGRSGSSGTGASSVHLHFVLTRLGTGEQISGYSFSGWRVESTGSSYQGRMIKAGEQDRVTEKIWSSECVGLQTCTEYSWGRNDLVSDNYPVVKQYKPFSTWIPWPGGWPFLFRASDSRVRRFTIGDWFSWDFERACDEVWVSLEPGNYLITFWYEMRGSGVPTLDVYAFPIPSTCAAEPENPPSDPDPQPTTDNAKFIADITIPDGSVLSPGQSFTKIWQMKNTGTSTWDSGYQLTFISGDKLSAPDSVSLSQSVSPGNTVDISVNMTAPSTGGSYQGDWQMRDPQGVYFGDKIWVKISVPGESGSQPPPDKGSDPIEIISLDYLSVVAPGQSFRPKVTVKVNQGQLLEGRGDMLRNKDGNLYEAFPHVAVVGTVNAGSTYTFEFYENDPMIAPGSEGSYESKWQVWRDGNWIGPEINISFDVRAGGGTRPDAPNLVSPANWFVARDGRIPTLCASAPAGLEYYFDIYDSHDVPDSGWISSNCWTPPGLGPYGYQWHVRVRDPSTRLISGWSETWHFNIEAQELTMDELVFSPGSPSDSAEVRIYTCVRGFGGIGLGLDMWANTATDGSASGEWYYIHTIGTFCYDQNDPNTWPNWGTLPLEDGTHLIRATGSHEGQTLVKEATYTLNRRKPPGLRQVFPVKSVKVNSRTVTFRWEKGMFRGIGSDRATEYELQVGADSDPAINPLVHVTLSPDATSYTHTFDQDYSRLVWRVIVRNEKGESDTVADFGIDRTLPSSNVSALDPTTTETTFPVSWSGSDNLAGVRWYDIQYRDGEHGEWTDWQVGVTQIANAFIGQPGHTYCFRSRALDNAGNWEAYPGGDGDTCTLVDPGAGATGTWWDTAYGYKRNLLVLNNDSKELATGYPVNLHFDDSTTPTAIELYNASQSSTKGDDLRIVHNDLTELPRFVQTFSSNRIDIWFNLQSSIGPTPGSDRDGYQLYYGNPSASNPPGGKNDILPTGTDGNTVGLWHLSEGSGTSVADSSGNGHTGSGSNMGWVEGKFGWSGDFNGTNSVVNLGSSNSYNVSNITLEAWVYPTNARGGEQTIFRKARSTSDSGLIYDFQVQEERVYLRLNGNSGFARSDKRLQDNRWYHIAGTYDGSNIKVYINGKLENSTTYSTPLESGSGTTLYLGGDARNNNKYFHGRIQHARLSNIARTSFPYGGYADVVVEPSVRAGDVRQQPQPGTPDLTVDSVATYNTTDGTLVQAIVTNQGDGSTGNGFWIDLYANHQPTGPRDLDGSIRYWVASPIEAGTTVTLTTLISNTQVLGASSAVLTNNQMNPLQETTGTLYVQADSEGSVGEADKVNNISAGTDVCLASADAFEGDDTPASATLISTDGITQTHNIHVVGDEDWFRFTATADTTYIIRTGDLGVNADTYLYLYDIDGTTLLASNDDYDGSLASQIEWAATANGTYYVMAKHWNPNVGGCETGYSIATRQELQGDLDNNCIVDITDIQTIATLWHEEAPTRYDYDNNKLVTIVDIMYIVSQWGATCSGTYNPSITLNFIALVGAGSRDNFQADITIEIRSPGESTSLFQQTVQTDETGHYQGLILAGLEPGTYDVYAKGFAHLARKKTIALTTGANAIDFSDGGTVYLAAGDVDGDNKVTYDDNEHFLSVFNTDDLCADFNGSGKVNILDYSSIIIHFGEVGDGGSWGISCITPPSPSQTADTYEPDNISGQASWINNGESQQHSIVPATDTDWVKFSLDENSAVVLKTTGENRDTRIWLYDNDLNEINFDDDNGTGFFSSINQCGQDPLPIGTYYVKIDEYGNNHEIACYGISLSTSACNPTPQILFTSGVSWDQPHDIYVVNDDGTNVRRITNGPGSNIDGRFSPDGSKIIFASDRSGDWYIYKMSADGTCVQQLAQAGEPAAPDWSPDGRHIAYTCPSKGICVMDAEGTDIRRLTSTYDEFPRWSHTGHQILYHSNRDGNWEIYVMDADGNNQINLTQRPNAQDVMPSWSPDDSKIAYTSWSEPYFDYLYVMNADGTGSHIITGNEHNEHPIWSPDGTRIVFNSNRAGQSKNVFIMDIDGSNLTQLTGQDDWPSDWWSPPD